MVIKVLMFQLPIRILTSNSDVEQSSNDRGPLHVVHPVVSQPMECLQEQQHCKQCYKLGAEVVTEHGEGKASFRHSVKEAFN